MKYREATMDDADIILSWRNDPAVFANFMNSSPVARESHLTWFADCLTNLDCVIVLAYEENEPLGMIRLDRRKDEDEVAIIVAPEHQGRGIGNQMLQHVCRQIRCGLVANIKTHNAASKRIFEKNGFKQIGAEREYLTYRRDALK